MGGRVERWTMGATVLRRQCCQCVRGVFDQNVHSEICIVLIDFLFAYTRA